jgi:hypothetical protein
VSWRWSSPKDAWSLLAGRLTDTLLEEFRQLSETVLGEEDPRYTLPMRERFAAAIHGKVLKHSQALRTGIAQSLARLSLADDSLSSTSGMHTGSSLVRAIIRTLLRPDWIAWASLSDVLPTLAESAPSEFLDAVTRSIDKGTDGVIHLFSEEGDFTSPHTGLLWALERLAWEPERMPRVSILLARLAEADPGGNPSPQRGADAQASGAGRTIAELSGARGAWVPAPRAALLSPCRRRSRRTGRG